MLAPEVTATMVLPVMPPCCAYFTMPSGSEVGCKCQQVHLEGKMYGKK
jgi:hypothetical protein